ncbi:hypothetical protein RRF57_011849 [Xylaria bambusicola]|uniref:40S ribosomal protein S24 n=1 Tax=Xylaria bambusicola TaxID=326684 RepID=A0AAN7ZAE3_9PEZI
MADAITIRTRRFRINPLLSRASQPGPHAVVSGKSPYTHLTLRDVLHPGRPGVSKSRLEEALAMLYKATVKQISISGLQTAFGGGKTTGFVCIYDSVGARMTFDAKYRLKCAGLASRADRQSKQNRSHWKNWGKRFRGTNKPKYPVLSVRWVTTTPL